MRLKYSLLCLSLMVWFLIPIKVHGQLAPLYSQYMFNGLLINPAYAGSQGSMNITALFRKQWTKLEGGPSTQHLTAAAPLDNQKIALGLIFTNDLTGVTRQTGADAIYAYRITFNEKSKLSFGLQTGFSHTSTDLAQVLLKDPNDPSFSTSVSAYSSLWFGTGIYYQTGQWYAGLASPHFQEIRIRSIDPQAEPVKVKNFLLTAGYVFPLASGFKLKPSTLIKFTDDLSTQADLNCTLLYENVLWVGLSYRTFTSLNVIAQVQVTDQLSLGYAYDNTVNQMRDVTKGGHEFMLSYHFTFFKSNVVTPRDF